MVFRGFLLVFSVFLVVFGGFLFFLLVFKGFLVFFLCFIGGYGVVFFFWVNGVFFFNVFYRGLLYRSFIGVFYGRRFFIGFIGFCEGPPMEAFGVGCSVCRQLMDSGLSSPWIVASKGRRGKL